MVLHHPRWSCSPVSKAEPWESHVLWPERQELRIHDHPPPQESEGRVCDESLFKESEGTVTAVEMTGVA